MNEYLIRWHPSPLPGRVLAFVFAPTPNGGLEPAGHMSFTLEQARDVHDFWPGSQQGWPNAEG